MFLQLNAELQASALDKHSDMETGPAPVGPLPLSACSDPWQALVLPPMRVVEGFRRLDALVLPVKRWLRVLLCMESGTFGPARDTA